MEDVKLKIEVHIIRYVAQLAKVIKSEKKGACLFDVSSFDLF